MPATYQRFGGARYLMVADDYSYGRFRGYLSSSKSGSSYVRFRGRVRGKYPSGG